jgi:hypothetical protein
MSVNEQQWHTQEWNTNWVRLLQGKRLVAEALTTKDAAVILAALTERERFTRLVEAVRALRTRHREAARQSNFNDCACDDCVFLQPILTAIDQKGTDQNATPTASSSSK